MNTRGHRFGGDWTEQKLDCVSKYLHAYTTIMNKQQFHYAYIDAFAGTGYREMENDEDADELMFPDLVSSEVVGFYDGSARNALEVELPFMKYIFIEKDATRYAELEELRKEFLLKDRFSEGMIECLREDANDYLKDLCRKNWKSHRALVFLDPYGMQVEWQTIESIAKTQAIDLWILFPIGMGVSRTLKNDGEMGSSERLTLDQFFGRDDWFDEFYQLPRQGSLFNEEGEMEKRDDILAEIEQYFLKRLESVFARVAENPLPLRNSNNSLMYLLCFAAGNPKAPSALEIAEDILKKMRDTLQLTLSV